MSYTENDIQHDFVFDTSQLDEPLQNHIIAERQRNTQLKVRIELEQKLLEIENRRLAAESMRTIEIEKQLRLAQELARLQATINSPSYQEQSVVKTPETNYLAIMVQQSIRGPNFKKFSGDSLHYPEFLMDFEQSACCVKSDPKMCLGILRGMLDGRALQSVAPYFLESDPAVALEEALAKLERCFGTPNMQCRAQLKRLLALPDVPLTEAGLLNFESELDYCFRLMRRCKRTIDLDSACVLKTLLAKLPEQLQDLWEK